MDLKQGIKSMDLTVTQKQAEKVLGNFFIKSLITLLKDDTPITLDYMGEQIILTHSSLSKPKPKKFIKVLNQVIKLDGVNIWSAESDYEVDEFLEAIIQANLDGLNGREYIIK